MKKGQASMTAGAASLKRCPLFQHFDSSHLEILALLASRMQYQKADVIFREDDVSSVFYVIVSGKIALEADVGPTSTCIQTLNAGDELGWSATPNQRRQFRARAVEPVELLAFESSALVDACKSNPGFGVELLGRLLAVIADRLQSTRIQLVPQSTEAVSAPDDHGN